MKTKKTVKKQQLLLEAFRTHAALTNNDICELLNCNRVSVANYISRLKENGCCIEVNAS